METRNTISQINQIDCYNIEKHSFIKKYILTYTPLWDICKLFIHLQWTN